LLAVSSDRLCASYTNASRQKSHALGGKC
jgi:hypothetical protein